MKIQIISDLHQEFGYTDLSFDIADIVEYLYGLYLYDTKNIRSALKE